MPVQVVEHVHRTLHADAGVQCFTCVSNHIGTAFGAGIANLLMFETALIVVLFRRLAACRARS